MLTSYLRKRVSVVTVDGRNLIGILHSADQLMNLVLTNCVERVLAPYDSVASNTEERDEPMTESVVGVMLLRGADVVTVGLIDVYEEAAVNTVEWVGRDMPPVARKV